MKKSRLFIFTVILTIVIVVTIIIFTINNREYLIVKYYCYRARSPNSQTSANAFRSLSEMRINDHETHYLIRGLLRINDITIKGQSINLLNSWNAVEMLPEIKALSADNSPIVRSTVAITLGWFENKISHELLNLLYDNEEIVRRGALESLRRIGSEDAVNKIIYIAENESGSVAYNAIDELGYLSELKNDRALSTLRRLAESHKSELHRKYIKKEILSKVK